MRKVMTTVAAVAAATLALASCSSDSGTSTSSTSSGETTASTEEAVYIFLPKSLNNPYWVDARKGMEAKADELGVTAQFLGPENDDAAAQVAIFDSILATNPAGIAISPNDPASVRDNIAKARAAGIPVIAWDGPVPDSEVLGYIGTDNVTAGEQAGEALATAVGGKGKVAVIIGSLGAVNLNQRLEGVKTALANYPDIEIVATEVSNESIATAQSAAETVLQANPDLAGFIGIGGSDLPGIAGALKSGNVCGTVKAVGFDVVPQGITGMEDGCVDALISQKPFGMTADALQILVDFHNGTSDLEEGFNVDTGVDTVTPDILEEFLKTAH